MRSCQSAARQVLLCDIKKKNHRYQIYHKLKIISYQNLDQESISITGHLFPYVVS